MCDGVVDCGLDSPGCFPELAFQTQAAYSSASCRPIRTFDPACALEPNRCSSAGSLPEVGSAATDACVHEFGIRSVDRSSPAGAVG